MLGEFAELDRRRLSGSPPLSVRELERWVDLREELGQRLGVRGGPHTGAERRGHFRLPSHVRVDFASGDLLRPAQLEDISEGGAFLVTERPLPVGTPLRLLLPTGDASEWLSLEAEVAWTRRTRQGATGPGMGLRFLGVDAEKQRTLEQLLLSRLSAPAPAAAPPRFG
jgi:uncharacterized protein (TIGR02266 family)